MIILEHFFSTFGLIAYLLLLASVAILALSIERLITIFIQPRLPIKNLQAITINLKKGDSLQVENYIAKTPLLYQKWIRLILDNTQKQAEDELSLNLMQTRNHLQRPLEWLNLFAIISPMLGLLGTIWSMSHSFASISKSMTSEGMHQMITYLSEAMYATAFGITLALISMLSLYFLRQKTESYLANCELWLNKILLAATYHNSLMAKN
ncbi:MAG: hypothetical protein EKK54_08980 [Neisseriaceae bacterium]|nr:MAG: hypothetical protein EKK54_08980 [Neisseriaceae bacterium]